MRRQIARSFPVKSETELRYVVGVTFERMIKAVLAAGQTRRFGDLFEIYPVVRGGFDRVDEQLEIMIEYCKREEMGK